MFILVSGLEYAGILLQMRFASEKNGQVKEAANHQDKWSSRNIDKIMLLAIPPIFLVFTIIFWLVV